MSITVLQKPSDIQPAQSPIVFSVITSGSQAYTASGFQYTANLYVWSGTESQSGSYVYQARKYPNQSGSGIFDFSRMINSTLTSLSADPNGNNSYTNTKLFKLYKAEFGWQYESGSTYVTQSGGLTTVSCSVGGTFFMAYDGYATFPEQINTGLEDMDTWPWMTDTYTVTQSVLLTDNALMAGTSRGIARWTGTSDTASVQSSPNYAYKAKMIATYTNGTVLTATSSIAASPGVISTANAAYNIAASPGDPTWSSFWWTTIPTASLDKYQISIINISGSQVGQPANYEVVCPHYYVPVRIAYKNRFGQFDWFNFYKRSNTQFNTDQRLYQPQLGSWQSSTLSYNQYQTKQQRYIVDATEVLECNTDYIEQGYNDLFKQMMVSDEIYWLYDNSNPNSPVYKPLTIQTNSLLFKTHINNKLIQYTITFDIGQPYKLIL